MFNILNIELTSLCNKNCHMCGRRKIERDYPELKLEYGEMSWDTLSNIHGNISPYEPILIQLHNNGEPLMYSKLKEALQLFTGHIRCLNTNGKLLVEKADDIIGNLETLTLSTFEGDEEKEKQWEIFQEFLKIKGDRKPNLIIRVLGEQTAGWLKIYKDSGLLNAKRILHKPMGSFGYSKKTTIPETGICQEMLNHPAINIVGDVSICVRFDPERKGVIGNINKSSLSEIWYGKKRQEWLEQHIAGKRNEVPLCSTCEFWGIPRG